MPRPASAASPAGVSTWRRNTTVRMRAAASARIHHGDSRNANSVPSKSMPMSAVARPPAAMAGRNGRRPVAVDRPMPCRMSRSSFIGTVVTMAHRRSGGPGGEPPSMGRRPPRGAARDLERYAGLFADRTKVMRSSAMRDLMAITERPDVISLAGGLPDTSTFPAESLAALLSKLAATDSARALQYAPTEGMAAVGEAIATVMAAEGMDVDPQDVLVTSGGQQVIDLVCKTLIDPGDVIVAEAPTYPGAVPAFSAYQADVVQIAMDDDGMRVEELEETLEGLERDGRRPKVIYTIPTFQNPAGVTMSLPRRQRLVQVARERELLVLEDNPYGLLRYEGDPLPTLRSLDGGDFVIYLGTFSKILSPGIRLGWTVAPVPVLEKMNLGKQASDLCSSSLSQLFVAAYFAEGRWAGYVASLRDLYRRRRDTMLDALAEHLPPEAAWTHPAGGLFIWATLPDYIDTTD